MKAKFLCDRMNTYLITRGFKGVFETVVVSRQDEEEESIEFRFLLLDSFYHLSPNVFEDGIEGPIKSLERIHRRMLGTFLIENLPGLKKLSEMDRDFAEAYLEIDLLPGER